MWVFGRLWMTLVVWTRKTVEYYKQNLMGCSCRSLEESSAKNIIVPGGNKDSNSNCDILAKHLAALCIWLKKCNVMD